MIKQTFTKIKAKPNGIKSNIGGGGSDSILAAMFQGIRNDLGINTIKWNDLMENYVRDPKNCIPNNIRDRASARGNLAKELLKNKMSWKVFCKSLRFFNILKFDLIIRAHHPNGKITEHIKSISIGDYNDVEGE